MTRLTRCLDCDAVGARRGRVVEMLEHERNRTTDGLATNLGVPADELRALARDDLDATGPATIAAIARALGNRCPACGTELAAPVSTVAGPLLAQPAADAQRAAPRPADATRRPRSIPAAEWSAQRRARHRAAAFCLAGITTVVLGAVIGSAAVSVLAGGPLFLAGVVAWARTFPHSVEVGRQALALDAARRARPHADEMSDAPIQYACRAVPDGEHVVLELLRFTRIPRRALERPDALVAALARRQLGVARDGGQVWVVTVVAEEPIDPLTNTVHAVELHRTPLEHRARRLEAEAVQRRAANTARLADHRPHASGPTAPHPFAHVITAAEDQFRRDDAAIAAIEAGGLADALNQHGPDPAPQPPRGSAR